MRRAFFGLAMRLVVGLTLLTVATGSKLAEAANAIGDCADDYTGCLQAWKIERLAFLKSNDGYLNLAGLFWLERGSQSFGGGDSVDVAFPGLSDGAIGQMLLTEAGVRITVIPGFDVRLNGRRFTDTLLRDDTSSSPDVVSFQNYSWTIIRRVNQFAVRLRDADHPALTDFASLDYFPPKQNMRVTARLHRYPEPKVVRVDTVIAGLDYNPTSPGVVKFAISGDEFELETYAAGDELFLVFGDTTNRDETYPAGRFLYAPAPTEDEEFILDFNTAHSPPCAYNDFATCPVAAPRNRLPIAIEAGERYDRSIH